MGTTEAPLLERTALSGSRACSWTPWRGSRPYPGIRFVIEHLFYPGRDHFEDVQSGLGKLAPFGNVSFTLASVPNSLMPEAYPFPSTSRYAGVARDVVGVERI